MNMSNKLQGTFDVELAVETSPRFRWRRKRKTTIMAKGTFTVNFTVEPAPPPPLSVASVEDLGTVGGQLAEAKVAISGGVPPYTVSVDSTSAPLPPGISIDSAGNITGTTTAAGSFPVVLDVADSVG